MKENTIIFVVMTGDHPEAAFSSEELADMFITTHERDYHTYIQPLKLDKADKYFDPEQYAKEKYIAENAFSAYDIQKPQDERVNHPKHYQHPSDVECITVARHHDFNTGSALKYLWRAGLKQEQGISPLDKQIEDLQKSVFYIYPQIKQSNAINIVVKSLIDDFTTDPEAELNYEDLDDFAKILAKNRKCGYVTMIPMNTNSPFRKIFIEPNLNEKGFLRQDRFATELTTENGVKYMLFFPWSTINNQNAPYNEK